MHVWRRSLNLALSAAMLFSTASALAPRAAAQTAAPAAAAPADLDAKLAAIEKAVEAKRQALGIPGLSLVIVKDDKVIYMKGLGYKDFEKQVPVTPDTLFAIGSSSKAFTALLLAMAVDEGKLSLDDSPKKFLPYFKLQDPDADARITLRDLLSHSSGLNRTDLAWVSGVLNREETIRVAAQAKPTAKLREKFQYQNVMYAAAGEIVGRAEKSTWEKLIGERIFKPLGMKGSDTSVPEMQKARDYSYGYVYEEATKETRRLPTRDLPAIAPAGAINSSARDMAQWLRLMLGGGEFEGKRLVSEKGFAELLRPNINVNPSGTVKYGLGWFLREWRGHKVAEHGGNIDGFNAQVALMPDQHLGFVMLTNVSASPLPASAMNVVWSNLVGDPAAPAPAPAAVAAADPAAKIENEVGEYLLEAANLKMAVAVKEGKLNLTVPGQPTYALEPAGGRRYKIAEGYYATFRPAKDNPQESELYLEQPQGNVALKKVKAADAATASASGASADYAGPLKEVVGSYEPEQQQGPDVEVAVRDGKVALIVPGQPAYPLVERSKDVLGSTALPETYSIVVRRDEAGRVAGITLKQPGNESVFNRAAEFKASMTVDELMAKVVGAMGGEAALRKHKTLRILADVDLLHQGVSGEAVIYARAPNAAAQDVTLKALGKQVGTYREFFDGQEGGQEGSFFPFDPKTGRELEETRNASDFYSPLNWKTIFQKAEIKKMSKVDGEDAYVVLLTPEKGSPVTQYISAKTFLPLRADTVATSDTISMPVTETYSDYRSVDGVMIAFRRVSNSQSMGDTVMKIREVTFDVPVPDGVFRRKTGGK